MPIKLPKLAHDSYVAILKDEIREVDLLCQDASRSKCKNDHHICTRKYTQILIMHSYTLDTEMNHLLQLAEIP